MGAPQPAHGAAVCLPRVPLVGWPTRWQPCSPASAGATLRATPRRGNPARRARSPLLGDGPQTGPGPSAASRGQRLPASQTSSEPQGGPPERPPSGSARALGSPSPASHCTARGIPKGRRQVSLKRAPRTAQGRGQLTGGRAGARRWQLAIMGGWLLESPNQTGELGLWKVYLTLSARVTSCVSMRGKDRPGGWCKGLQGQKGGPAWAWP